VEYATGEAKDPPLRPAFDRRIKLEFPGARITSDGGLLAYRELDDVLSCAMDATSSSSWLRWRCPEPCSPRSCVGSIGSDPNCSRHQLGRGDEGTRQRGASTINACRPKLGPNVGRKARKFGSARAALLPIRSGLLAHREGRKLDRHLGNLGLTEMQARGYR
jgi:hypothetical protein